MDDNRSEEYQDDAYGWAQRKPASELPSSEGSMDNDRKEMIRRALEFDIIDIRSYTGYKGDMLVEITTMDPSVINSLKKIAEEIGLDTVVQKDIIDVNKLFCITPATDIYELKV